MDDSGSDDEIDSHGNDYIFYKNEFCFLLSDTDGDG